MVANIRGYTPNYNFKLINFDVPRWHTLEYSNWSLIDALMTQTGVPNFRGEWLHSTLYNEGDRVQDGEDGHLYRALVKHTSASSGTMGDERAMHPEYWTIVIPGVPIFRGEWAPGATYAQGDIVYVGYDYYLCTDQHFSSPTFATDVVDKWELVFSATAVVNDAETAANAAASSATDADASADAAEGFKNEASGFADAAEDSATESATSAAASSTAQGAFRWNFDANIAMADPGTGKFRANNLFVASATSIALSSQSGDPGNPDVSDWIVTWDDSTNPSIKGTLYLRKVGAPENFAIFNLTGTVSDLGTWLQVGVTHIASNGTFTSTSGVSVSFIRSGNQGLAGPGGGDMLSLNYLSELTTNKPLARTNIGLGSSDTPTFAQVNVSNAPSIDTHAVNKTYLETTVGAAVNTKVTKAGDTMTGPLILTHPGDHNGMMMKADATFVNYTQYSINNVLKWQTNFGTDVIIFRYDASGVLISGPAPLAISGATGLIEVAANPTTALGVATKQYVDTNAVAVANTKVAKAGDTMTGNLGINVTAGGGIGPKLILTNNGQALNDGATIEFYENNLRGLLAMQVVRSPYGTDLIYTSGNGPQLEIFRAQSDGVFSVANSLYVGTHLHIGNLDPASQIMIGDYGHVIRRVAATGRMLLGGGQDVVEISSANPLVVTNVQAGSLGGAGALRVSGGAWIGGTLVVGAVHSATYGASGGIYYFGDGRAYIVFDGTNFGFNVGTVYVPALHSYGTITCQSTLTAPGAVFTGDIWVRRDASGGPNTGLIFFGNTGGAYIYYDTATYNFVGGNVAAPFLYASPGIGIGSGITTGLYGDGGGIAIRAYGNNGVYIQNSGGSFSYATFSYGSFSPNAGNAYVSKGGTSAGPAGSGYTFNWVGWLQYWVDDSMIGSVSIPTSDYRIKKDVIDLPSTWDAIKQLRPIRYTQAEFTPPKQIEFSRKDKEHRLAEKIEAREYKPTFEADDVERWGFVAHEMQETLLPSAVIGDKDDPDAIQSLNLLPIIAGLTKALQEAMTRIEALEAS